MVDNKLVLKAGGPAGSGIFTVGTLFAKLCQKLGYCIVYTDDYPSLIKGGHNTCTVRVEDEKIYSHLKFCDVLVAIDEKTVKEHWNELTYEGAIIYDSSTVKRENINVPRGDIRIIGVPMQDIGKEIGDKLFSNIVALGAVAGLLSMDLSKLNALIEKNFAKKGQTVVDNNVKAAKRGHDFLKENFRQGFKARLNDLGEKDTLFINGNDASSAGAVKAGVHFVAEYPMTPSSSFLHFMAAHEKDHNIIVKHTEDEISAMNMIVGASMTGVRAFTATSGGGFALMSEALGMAGIMEAPVVIVESQRTGPSTGLPTYTEQSDLNFVLNASQGEFPRIVVAPGDVEEAFYETFNVFNYAERVQTPAIVLLDKHISASSWSTPRFDMSKMRIERGKMMSDADMEKKSWPYKRYELTPDGISPRCFPGQKNGMHVMSSYEHDETGWTTEDIQMRVAQVDKRDNKMKAIADAEIAPKFYGDREADLTIVSWGSNKNMILEAIKHLRKDGYKVNFLHVLYLSPFPTEAVTRVLSAAKKALIIEQNKSGMLRDLINIKTHYYIKEGMFKYDGRPFDPEDIYDRARRMI